MPKNFSLKRSKILRKKTDFDLLKKGAYVRKLNSFTFICKESPDLSTKVAFIVSKKVFSRAVDRNRVRRIMKEAYRTQKNIFTKASYMIFIAHKDIKGKKSQDLISELISLKEYL